MPDIEPQVDISPRPSRVGSAIGALLRTRIMAGLVTVLPIFVTFIVVSFVFGLMRDSSRWLVEGFLHGEWLSVLPASWRTGFRVWTPEELQHPGLQWGIAIFSVFLTIFLLYVIGLLTANFLGRRAVALMETLVDRLPLIKTIYRATKQVLETFSGSDGKQKFQRVVLLPFMAPGVKTIGFVTSTFQDPNTGEELCTIFYATTPNPTTGFILVVPKSQLVELDWTMEEAAKAIISGGIILPAPLSFVNAPAPEASRREPRGAARVNQAVTTTGP
ncbi:MAG: DUF502 domain-containing protein [Phycisphaerales bacterium]|nr:DUF502 domain-containing protein [Phycisphaerales bacterium]